MISSIQNGGAFISVSAVVNSDNPVVVLQPEQTLSIDPALGGLKISSLARQLGESAALAGARHANLDRRELGIEAGRLLDQISGDAYQANKESHNAFSPVTDDDVLLERARLATEYVVRHDQHDRSVVSPFAGLSRELLNLIVYDESGSYTINERRAAFIGVNQYEWQWRQQLMRDASVESANNAGQTPRFYAEVIAHYNALPHIEQVQYPDDYVAKTLAQIDQANNPVKIREPKLLTLFEILAIMLKRKKIGEAEEGEKLPIVNNSAGADSGAAA